MSYCEKKKLGQLEKSKVTEKIYLTSKFLILA